MVGDYLSKHHEIGIRSHKRCKHGIHHPRLHYSSVAVRQVEWLLVPLAHGAVRRQRSLRKIRRNPLTSTIQSWISESRGVSCTVDDQYGRIWERFGHRENTRNFCKLKKDVTSGRERRSGRRGGGYLGGHTCAAVW